MSDEVRIMELAFTKMHGLGNCFILMDDRGGQVSKKADVLQLAEAVCDRNFGIGADGLILVRDSDEGDLAMQIINEDGSEAEMCGNGIRCFARFVVEEGITDSVNLAVSTGAGIIRTRLMQQNTVEVDMGEPSFEGDDLATGDSLDVREEGRKLAFVSMGNPHAVTFVDEYEFDWRAEGSRIETAPSFPNKTNVEYIKVVSPKEVEMKVWERGCGETMACGTGACASVVAGARTGLLERDPVTVHLPGGDLKVHWNKENRVMMTGPTVRVCDGTYLYFPEV